MLLLAVFIVLRWIYALQILATLMKVQNFKTVIAILSLMKQLAEWPKAAIGVLQIQVMDQN